MKCVVAGRCGSKVLHLLLGFFLVVGAAVAQATTMEFIGTGSYQTSGSSISISFAQLKNTSTNRSGTLYLKLVAVPVNASILSSHVMAEGTFLNLLGTNYGTLEAGASFVGITLQTSYKPPPAGSYNVYLQAYEYPYLSSTLASVPAIGNPKIFNTPVNTDNGADDDNASSGGSTGSGTLDLQCACSYTTSGDSINLKAVRVTNNTGRTSGTLRLKLWATAQPYSGGAIGGYELASYTFASTLENNAYYTNIDVSVPYGDAPEGTWYLTMTLTEYKDGQDYVMDHTSFDKTLTITASGGTGGTTGPATASIDLLCDCSYETNATVLTLNAYRVENNAGRSTGTLKLQLWASTQPYNGTSISGYKMGEYTLGSLVNNQYFYGIRQNVTYTAPPAGTYYVTMMLTETSGSDVQVDYVKFDKTITVSGSTTSSKPIDLVCSCAYSVSGTNVNFTASRVLNQAGRSTGTLYLRLIASSTPYTGGQLTGYKLGEYTFSQALTNNQYYNTVNVTVPYTQPQPGTWYYTLGLIELRNGAETLVDYSAFSTAVVIPEPIPTGASTAPYILSPSNGYNIVLLPARTEHYYKIVVTQAGTLTLETSGALRTVARLANSQNVLVAQGEFGGAGNNFKLSVAVTPGTYSMQLYDYYGTSGLYTIQSSFTAAAAISTQPVVYAAPGSSYSHPASVGTISTAAFGAGLTTDGGVTYSKTASLQDTVTLVGTLEPEVQHRGLTANIYVVERINGTFYMRNTSDQLVPWSDVKVASLVPFRTGVTLSAANQFTIMTGKFTVTGDHSIFVGYVVAGQALRYNGSAVRLTVTE